MEMVHTNVLGTEDMQPFLIAKLWIRNNSHADWMLSRKDFLGNVRRQSYRIFMGMRGRLMKAIHVTSKIAPFPLMKSWLTWNTLFLLQLANRFRIVVVPENPRL